MKKVKILSLLLAAILSVGILFACTPPEAVNTDSHSDAGKNAETSQNTTPSDSDSSGEETHLCVPFVHDEAPEAEILNINWDIATILESENNLLNAHLRGKRFPVNFVPLLLEGSSLLPASASTPEEAISKVLSLHTAAEECVLLFETEYCYGFYVRETNGMSTRVTCFKGDVFSFDAEGKYLMKTDAPGAVRRVMDFIYYRSCALGGSQVVQTELLQGEEGFTYTAYYIETVYGDWDVPNFVSFYKQVTEIPTDGTPFTLGEKVCLKTTQYHDVYPSVG